MAPTSYLEQWTKAANLNIDLVNKAVVRPIQYDVVFLGDSITEHWNGRDIAEFEPNGHNISLVFQDLFEKDKGGTLQGLPLGIAGDRVSERKRGGDEKR